MRDKILCIEIYYDGDKLTTITCNEWYLDTVLRIVYVDYPFIRNIIIKEEKLNA